MIINVDLTEAGRSAFVWLVDVDDLKRLEARAIVREEPPDWEALERAFEGIARVDPVKGQVRISAAALGQLAGARSETQPWRRAMNALATGAEGESSDGPDGTLSAAVSWDLQVEVEPDVFRHVLGHFPTGVAVLTANRPDGPVGMACNSLTSVSLEPPLIAVCPAKTSETWPEIREAGRFVINLVPRQHEETVVAFARKGLDRFATGAFHPRRSGPALDDAMAWIECVIEAEHDAGDHTVVLAKVTALEASHEVEPLVFFRGRYGTFAAAGS